MIETPPGLTRIDEPWYERCNLVDLVERVRAIPYGRSSTLTVEAFLAEGRGTRTSKHRFLFEVMKRRFPETEPQLVHRVYHLSREDAIRRFGPEIGMTVRPAGLMDVHRYLLISRAGRRIPVDATFPGAPWDGFAPMELACGWGRDYAAGDDPDWEKLELEHSYCDDVLREPFLLALERTRPSPGPGTPMRLGGMAA